MDTASPTKTRALQSWLAELPAFFLRPVTILRNYDLTYLRPDVLAGLTVAFVMLPQAIAYALIAELPPQTGLYAAVVASIVGALWGSSIHLHTGPTNAASLLVLSTLSVVAVAGSPEYVALAGVMALLVGVIRLLMGLARLGGLVNFVADSVIIGFTAGAGILIGVGQLRHLFGLTIETSPLFLRTAWDIVRSLPTAHLLTTGLGVLTLALIVLLKRFRPKWPSTLISIIVTSALVAIFRLDEQGVLVLGQLPRTLPPLARLPFDYAVIRQILTGVLAVSLIGTIEATSIARSIAAQSGQRLDSDQEFVGQGLANIAAGLFSGYTTSASFTRSAINYEAGAKSPLAVVFAGIFVLIAMLLLAPFAAYLPRAALAGVIVIAAYSMVDRAEMRRIWHTSQGDSAIMVATMVATLLLPLEFAVLTGVFVAFVRYISKTSTPEVTSVVPDAAFEHFAHQPDKPVCPQLAVLTIAGSLYFGATHHVEEEIRQNLEDHPLQKYLLLRMHRVNLMDVSGLHMLETVVRLYREQEGDVYLTGVRREVLAKLEGGGFVDVLGRDHFLPQERAIAHLFYKILDPAQCIYHCRVRVWRECQSLPKSTRDRALPHIPSQHEVPRISAESLYHVMLDEPETLVIDVRESAEYASGHIPGALLWPLPRILDGDTPPFNGRVAYITCRTSRRSVRASQTIFEQSGVDIPIVEGGMLAWEEAGLPEVIE